MDPLTTSESAILQRDGQFIMKAAMPLAIESIFWGIYLLVIYFSSLVLWRRGMKTRARKILFAVNMAMFILSTSLYALDMGSLIAQTNIILLAPTIEGETLADKVLKISLDASKIGYALTTIFSVEFLLGDTIVIWRTWAIWGQNWLAVLVPGLLWFAAAVALIAERVVNVQEGGLQNPFVFGAGGNLELASFILSMSVNLASTTMIAIRACKFYEAVKGRRTAGRILIMLVESGFFYLVFWVVRIPAFFIGVAYGPALLYIQFWNYIARQVVGLYPALIIVLVELQRSFWDESGWSSDESSKNTPPQGSNSKPGMSTIKFAGTLVFGQGESTFSAASSPNDENWTTDTTDTTPVTPTFNAVDRQASKETSELGLEV